MPRKRYRKPQTTQWFVKKDDQKFQEHVRYFKSKDASQNYRAPLTEDIFNSALKMIIASDVNQYSSTRKDIEYYLQYQSRRCDLDLLPKFKNHIDYINDKWGKFNLEEDNASKKSLKNIQNRINQEIENPNSRSIFNQNIASTLTVATTGLLFLGGYAGIHPSLTSIGYISLAVASFQFASSRLSRPTVKTVKPSFDLSEKLPEITRGQQESLKKEQDRKVAKQQRNEESERRREEERQRQEEEQRKKEEEREKERRREEGRKKKAAEKIKRKEKEQKQREEEREKKRAEKKRRREEERQNKAEEQRRRQELEKQRQEKEQKQREEERERRKEEERQKKEVEQRRRQELERQQKEQEKNRLEKARKQQIEEEARRKEQQKRAEVRKSLEEKRKKEKEARKETEKKEARKGERVKVEKTHPIDEAQKSQEMKGIISLLENKRYNEAEVEILKYSHLKEGNMGLAWHVVSSYKNTTLKNKAPEELENILLSMENRMDIYSKYKPSNAPKQPSSTSSTNKSRQAF